MLIKKWRPAVAAIDNPYFPVTPGNTLVYRGVRDGKSQTDRSPPFLAPRWSTASRR